MEIASIPITTCSKEHQQIYQEWFNYADAGTYYRTRIFISTPLFGSREKKEKKKEKTNRRNEKKIFKILNV